MNSCGPQVRDRTPTTYRPQQAADMAGVLDQLGIARADLVTHDIGNMVGYAFATQYFNRVTRFALIDASLSGRGKKF